MGIQLQILIPLLVTLVALAAIAIKRKFFRLETLVICAAVLGLAVWVWKSPELTPADNTKKVEDISNSDRISLVLAHEHMRQGEYDEAVALMAQLQKINADDPELQLAMARCHLLQGNYVAAVQMYRQLENPPEAELTAAVTLHSGQAVTDDAVVRYLSDRGKNAADYGLAYSSAALGDRDAVYQWVLEEVDAYLEGCRETYGQEVTDAAHSAAQISREYALYAAGDYWDEYAVEEALAVLVPEMEKSQVLSANSQLRIARMKGYLLNGRYSELAACADEDLCAEELLVLSELYLHGWILDSDIPQDYAGMELFAGSEKVLEACEKALEASREKLSIDEYSAYSQKLEALRTRMAAPGFYSLQLGLQRLVAEGDAGFRSQGYLALAKMEIARGDEDLADTYLSGALNTAGYSNDENYQAAMVQIQSVVQGTADNDAVLELDTYVDRALDNALPVELPDTGEDILDEEIRHHVEDTVSKGSATLNIGVINKEAFPQISARVQIQSSQWSTAAELEENLLVYDCGSSITDFRLEKLTFTKSRIILLCDVSGSMAGSEQALKNAIIAFAEKMQPGEEVCVVGFDDEIVFVEDFSDDPDVVAGYADKIDSLGGTALFESLLYCENLLTQDVNVNNVIIAMTDGQDGNAAKEGDMYQQVGGLAARTGATVYTLGLGGGVDMDYLELMAQCGNGSFLLVENDEKLNEFYDFIHGQLANQYVLSYTAKNTTKNQRLLELAVRDEMGGAQRVYYLQDPEYTNEGGDAYDPYTPVDVELLVTGLNTKFLYKSTKDQTVQLRGSGFDSGDDVTFRLQGNVNYELAAVYVNETTYEIVIPPEIAVGTYDVSVSIRNESFTLEKELSIATQATQKNFRFGAYNFTALRSYVDDEGYTVLSGNVVMNGWLYFKGDVTVCSRNYNNAEWVDIRDEGGIYISYQSATAMGLAQDLAEKGSPISLGSLGTFRIYRQAYEPKSYTDFPVKPVDYLQELNLLFLVMENMEISVYPDMLMIQGFNLKLELPFQKQLLKNLDFEDIEKLKLDSHLILGATQVAAEGEFSCEYDEGESFNLVSLPLALKELKGTVDTLYNNYSLEAKVELKALADKKKNEEAGFVVNFGIKDGKFDAIGLQINGPEWNVVKTPVPITMKDFGLELSGFSQYASNNSTLKNLLGTTVTAKFEVDVADVTDILPELAESFKLKSMPVATLADCELALTLKELHISFDAKLKLFDKLECGKCHVSLGKFKYSNALIGYHDETQYGLQVSATLGVDWDSANLDAKLQGTGEVTLGYPYTGLWLNGQADFDLNWWIVSAEKEVAGDLLVGLYKNSADNLQFSFIVRGTKNDGSYSGFHLYVTRANGLGMNTY